MALRFDAALCLQLSRFNHSCRPNLEQSWDADTGQAWGQGNSLMNDTM